MVEEYLNNITTKSHLMDLVFMVDDAFDQVRKGERHDVFNLLFCGVTEAIGHDWRATRARHPWLNNFFSSSEPKSERGYWVCLPGSPGYDNRNRLTSLYSPRGERPLIFNDTSYSLT